MAGLRVLVPGDEARLFEFLEQHVDTSLFFFSNVEKAGLEDRGEALQATYVARFSDSGAITAVVAHAWNRNLLVQGDEGLEEAAVEAVACSGRDVNGLIGPWVLVNRVRTALKLERVQPAHAGREVLMTLPLQELKAPALLTEPGVAFRVPTLEEPVGPLREWRVEYSVETLGATRGAALEEESLKLMRAWHERRNLWVLTLGGEIASMTGFNAETRGIVQVGGVYTPPALRSRGYARAAVAGSLKLAP